MTDCCPFHPIPETLYAVPRSGSVLGTGTITLSYTNPAPGLPPIWSGSIPACGGSNVVTVVCQLATWGGAALIGTATPLTVVVTLVSCDPLHLILSGTADPLSGCPGAFSYDIVETAP